MCKVYCCCNQKGGTNKTTVVANLGIGLARAGAAGDTDDKHGRRVCSE